MTKKKKDKEICSKCKFFVLEDYRYENRGKCFRYPPKLVRILSDDIDCTESIVPETHSSSFCGEFVKKKGENND